jgi:hypothetical protein
MTGGGIVGYCDSQDITGSSKGQNFICSIQVYLDRFGGLGRQDRLNGDLGKSKSQLWFKDNGAVS